MYCTQHFGIFYPLSPCTNWQMICSLYFKMHATSLSLYAFPSPFQSSDVYILYGCSQLQNQNIDGPSAGGYGLRLFASSMWSRATKIKERSPPLLLLCSSDRPHSWNIHSTCRILSVGFRAAEATILRHWHLFCSGFHNDPKRVTTKYWRLKES